MKNKAALAFLILSFIAIIAGFSRGEWKKIYANGRTLCLTCIGIK